VLLDELVEQRLFGFVPRIARGSMNSGARGAAERPFAMVAHPCDRQRTAPYTPNEVIELAAFLGQATGFACGTGS